ncbi:S8 family serine peptidase [Asanoa ishikariensis]|nr:S8 family serine peptidase [Asanoa ishikariensis]
MRQDADTVRSSQWHLRFLNVEAAQQVSKGDGVEVAIVDTGVDPHRDLDNNLRPGAVVDPRSPTGDGRTDSDGHGTAMAGLIAAHGRGPDGALGIAPRSQIVPVTISSSGEPVSPDVAAAGIEWATTRHVEVINLSYSGGPSSSLREAVERAIEEDIVVVAAVGNRPSRGVEFPAMYPGVLAVGAVDKSGSIADISVTGQGVVLTAPGVDIHSTSRRDQYQRADGTSDAAAIVSGAVALVRSRFPELPAEEVVHRLTATATDRGSPGRDDEYGFGVLNIVAALTADVPPLSPSASAATPSSAGDALPPVDGHRADGSAIWIAALVGAGVVIGVFILIVLARRHRVGRRPVP